MKDCKIFTKEIEQQAVDQINTLINHSAFEGAKVRIMPDVHAGKGCVIGFTADLGNKVIPNIVGVDIGCGMLTVKLGDIDIDLQKLDNYIKQNIPSGFSQNAVEQDYPIYLELNIKDVCKRLMIDDFRQRRAVGSLGGGNHFIELDINSKGEKYLVIHTGSRNFGYQVAKYYQDLAIKSISDKTRSVKNMRNKEIGDLKRRGLENEIQKTMDVYNKYINELDLPKDLCYLDGAQRDNYLHDMGVCQQFAKESREVIARKICDHLGINLYLQDYFHTVHNYIDLESNIVRKGAISAKLNERILIPLNMRDGSILAIGKGNKDWNYSAPHGAGRLMSRTKAKEEINIEDFKDSMDGIFSSCICNNTIDESPMAYKSADGIIDNVKDTVEIFEIIKPIYNFKATN